MKNLIFIALFLFSCSKYDAQDLTPDEPVQIQSVSCDSIGLYFQDREWISTGTGTSYVFRSDGHVLKNGEQVVRQDPNRLTWYFGSDESCNTFYWNVFTTASCNIDVDSTWLRPGEIRFISFDRISLHLYKPNGENGISFDCYLKK